MSFHAEHRLIAKPGFFNRFFATSLLKQFGSHRPDLEICISLLMEGTRKGHLCMTEEMLGGSLQDLPPSLVEEGLSPIPRAPIVHSHGRYYLQKNWVYETTIVENTKRLRKGCPSPFFDRTAFATGLAALASQLLPAQQAALQTALQKSLLVICGGPGTGKTYSAGHLANLLFHSLSPKQPFRIVASAPTGKAAAALKASLKNQMPSSPLLHIEAMTLHRMLKLQPESNKLFSHRPIDAHLVIVDEASMMDVSLLAHLLEAISDETLLVLMGDPNQLPPVEASSLFAEMGQLFGFPLNTCVRTEEPILQKFAEAIQKGNKEVFFSLLALNHPSLLWKEEIPSPEALYKKILPFLESLSPDPLKSFQQLKKFLILNTLRQGPYGTDALNQKIFEQVISEKKSWIFPILSTTNDSFLKLYNGVNGLLIGQSLKNATAYFPEPNEKEDLKKFSPPPPFEFAFCLSIHKSQGSEFEEVLALFPEGSETFGKEALYTAVTRAKNRLEIRGRREVLEKMIQSSLKRNSGFSTRILEENPQFL